MRYMRKISHRKRASRQTVRPSSQWHLESQRGHRARQASHTPDAQTTAMRVVPTLVAPFTMSETAENEVERLKKECSNMIKVLKGLEDEELDLQCQNRILAREALVCGYEPNVIEPPPPKRRRTPVKKKPATGN